MYNDSGCRLVDLKKSATVTCNKPNLDFYRHDIGWARTLRGMPADGNKCREIFADLLKL